MITKFPFQEVISFLKSIEEMGEKNKKTVERIEQVQDTDHKDFKEMERRLSHLEVEVKSLIETVGKIPNQTRDRLAEASEAITTGAAELTEAIKEAEVVAVDKTTIEKQKKHWWNIEIKKMLS